MMTCNAINNSSPDQGSTMASADIEMDIVGDDMEASEGYTQAPLLRYYQASEIIPDKKGPLHDLLQKQPAVLGVRKFTYSTTVLS